MSIKNRYIYVESQLESELVQTLLFEAGAGWMCSGKSPILRYDIHIIINDELEMSVRYNIPEGYKELSLLELINNVNRDDSVENNTLHVCTIYNNHISFKDTEVALTPVELSEVLRIIQAIPDRDAVITIREESTEDEEISQLTNLSIEFI